MSKITPPIAPKTPDLEISVRQILIGLAVSGLIRLGVTGEQAANIAALAAPAILWGLDQLAFRLKVKGQRI